MDTRSGGQTNFKLFFDICKKKNISIYLCPILKTVESLNFISPFNNIKLSDLTQNDLDNYFINNNNNNTHIINKNDIVPISILQNKKNVVIYFEDVENNPAEQEYVVRWLHFFPVEKALKNYNFNSDYICFFSDYIYNLYKYLCNEINIEDNLTNNIKKLNILRVFHFNKNIYKNKNYNRNGICFTYRKGFPPFTFIDSKKYIENKNKIINDNNEHYYFDFETSLSHNQLIELFNKKKIFISYDPFTFTSLIASLCGCISIVKKIKDVSLDTFINSDPFNKYGIAYGEENIFHALNTQEYLYEHLLNLYSQNEDNIHNFIIDIEKFFNINIAKNVNTQNVNTQNVNTQNVNTQNVNTQNVNSENVNSENKIFLNKNKIFLNKNKIFLNKNVFIKKFIIP
jgi:hypothetical protein